MFRTMTTALALAALLMVAACNSVTGPATDLGNPTVGGNGGPGGDRRGNEMGKGVELVPDPPDGGGGSGSGGSGPREPLHVAPGARGPRVPAELTPPSDDPTAGSGGGDAPIGDPAGQGTGRRSRPSDRGEHGPH